MERIRELLRDWQMSPRSLIVVVALCLVVLAIIVFPSLNAGRPVVKLTGTVIAPLDMPDRAANGYYMRVALTGDQEVRVPISRDIPIRPGQVVVLDRREGPLGVTTYQFEGYVDSGGR